MRDLPGSATVGIFVYLLCVRLCHIFLCWLANSGAQSPFLIRFLLLPMIRSVLSNMYEMERFLQKTEDINWTVVRPPGLKNLAASGESRKKVEKTKQNQRVK